jgi:integrase
VRRASLGTTDPRQAEIELAKWITLNGDLNHERPAEVPLEAVLVRYWERHARHVPMATSLKANLAFWSEFFPAALVAEVTVARQHQFVDWLKAKRVARTGQPYSSSYIKKIVAAGAAALRDAHGRGELESIPALIEVKEHRPSMRRLEVSEVAALLDAIRADHLYMFVMLALNTLSRPGALLELRREQCSLRDRLIFLNPDGREQTRKFRPVVPITDTLYPLIEAAGPGLLVQWRGKPVRQLSRVWRETVERAGLGPGADRMTLRRTMARELRRRGVQPWDLGGLMGHKAKDHDTTEIYAAYDPKYLLISQEYT